MYVVIVLLLLRVLEFTYSMDPLETQLQQLIPFDFEYTNRVHFLKDKTKDFMLNLENRLLLNISSSIGELANLNWDFSRKCNIKINYIDTKNYVNFTQRVTTIFIVEGK